MLASLRRGSIRRMKSGTLRISGPALDVEGLIDQSRWNPMIDKGEWRRADVDRRYIRLDDFLSLDLDACDRSYRSCNLVWEPNIFLAIGSMEIYGKEHKIGLMLREDAEGNYRRLGLFDNNHGKLTDKLSLVAGWEERGFVIV